MRFESAHTVPKLFKFLHFVTSLLIAYDGPRGPSQATWLSKHNFFFLRIKSFFADGIQTIDQASNMVGVKYGERKWSRPKKVMQLQGAHRRGGFWKLIFHMVLYILKFTCLRVTFKLIIVHRYITNERV